MCVYILETFQISLAGISAKIEDIRERIRHITGILVYSLLLNKYYNNIHIIPEFSGRISYQAFKII